MHRSFCQIFSLFSLLSEPEMCCFALFYPEPTLEKLMEGWKIVCEQILPKMEGISKETRNSIVAYLEQFWLSPKWRAAWTDFGRAKHNVPFMMVRFAGSE